MRIKKEGKREKRTRGEGLTLNLLLIKTRGRERKEEEEKKGCMRSRKYYEMRKERESNPEDEISLPSPLLQDCRKDSSTPL